MIDLGILIGVGGFLLAIMTFLIGRQTSLKTESKADGATLATIQADIKFVREKITELSISSEKRSLNHDESIRRIHEKIEILSQQTTREMMEHIQKYHIQDGAHGKH